MKKIIILLAILAFAPSVYAKTVLVEALSPFSTEAPPSTFKVKLLEDCELNDTLTIYSGSTVNGSTLDVVSPKRLKRDATFSFIPKSYTNVKDGITYPISEEYIGKYTTKIDKKELAKSTSLAVGSFFVQGLSLGVNAVEGAIKNEEGNRFKSSATNVYEHSPFSYVETGNELNIKVGDIFYLKFKTNDNDELEKPNYEYKEINKD